MVFTLLHGSWKVYNAHSTGVKLRHQILNELPNREMSRQLKPVRGFTCNSEKSFVHEFSARKGNLKQVEEKTTEY